MSMHTFHPDTHKHGLQPGCRGCEEHAEHPQDSLDAENRARLIYGHVFTDLDRKARDILIEAGEGVL